jgi:hypothetical protein
MSGAGSRPAGSRPAALPVLAVPAVRRLEAAWLLSVLAELTGTVAMTVFAFRQGGPALVGIYAAARTLPVAAVTPVLMALPVLPERLLAGSTALRAGLLLAAALSAGTAGPGVAVALAAAASVLTGGFRALLGALSPWLARSPRELAGINVLASGTESVGVLAGPAAGALLLAVLPPEGALAATAVLLLPACLLLLAVRLPAPAGGHAPASGHRHVGRLLLDPVRGLRDLAALAPPGGLLVLLLAQTALRGVLSVLLVVLAAGTVRGEAAVGDLYAVMGAGGLVGGLAAAWLVRVGRLGRCFVAGLLLWGLPLALLGLRPGFAAGLVAMALVGVGNALQDVAETTLTPALAGVSRLPRVLGAIEVVAATGAAAGSSLAAVAVLHAGAGRTLLIAGTAMAALALLHLHRFARIDRGSTVPAARAALLRELEIFRPLPMATVELLAGRVEERSFPAGAVVLREGEGGDRWFLVEDGEVAVTVRGATRRLLGPGEGFGEIALLRDVPRTATVTAVTPLRCLTLDRDDFLPVVIGHAESAAAAHRTTTALLSLDPR